MYTGRFSIDSASIKVFGVLGLALIGEAGYVISYVALMVWALLGPRRAVEALTLAWLLQMLNPELFSIPEARNILRWGVLMCSSVTALIFLLKRDMPVPKVIKAHFYFLLGVSIFSVFKSPIPLVSVLKIGVFFVGASTITILFFTTSKPVRYFRMWFISFFGVVVLLSATLIPLDVGWTYNEGIGYYEGFRGITRQSQVYGVFLSPFVAWLFSLHVSGNKVSRIITAIVLISFVSLILTHSRTAIISLSVGVVYTLAYLVYNTRPLSKQKWLGSYLIVLALIVVSLGIFKKYNNSIRTSLTQYVMKEEGARRVDLVEGAESRIALMAKSISNFQENTLTGIGFGVPSTRDSQNIQYIPGTSIPISAPVEKGVVLTAVLEEVGLIGFLLFAYLLYTYIRPSLTPRSNMPIGALVITTLFLNLGESILFAIGGTGLLVWLILSFSYVSGHRQKEVMQQYI
ncbi:hypothetical protein GGP57_002195 [Salinibacter ruber]|uniref:O-antigen ligase family protein n=1 Tax=Salinibacter ruber TaxID=146919 RepID=UPI0021683FDB|nr:O-antigen ligase family protein [Salinibacter ruber]MCS3634862.1 hypothetical protein [Salinibacter ruber]MCS3714663.1 hypothetical protein [Salinibacter ruber]